MSVSLQITNADKHTDSNHKYIETKQLQGKVKKKKSEAKTFLIDTIRQCGKRIRTHRNILNENNRVSH